MTLAERVTGLTPADPAEAESQARILELIATSKDAFSRHDYSPGHLTASALVVDPTRTRALLIFHHKLQLWLQPGGHFEPGERDPLEAAQREVEEETGLAASPVDLEPLFDLDVHPIPARRDQPAHEHFDLRFLLVAASAGAIVGDGVEAVRWVSLDDAKPLDLDPGLRRMLDKALRAP